MPHIIVEYAEQLLSRDEIDELLTYIHNSVVASGLFEASHIKTRAYSFKHFTQAGGQAPYIHVQARIKSGRDVHNKKQLSELILDNFKKCSLAPHTVVTVEVIDMNRESYSKIVL